MSRSDSLLRGTVYALFCFLAACGESNPDTASPSSSGASGSASGTSSALNTTTRVALSASQYSVAVDNTVALKIDRIGGAAGTASASYTTVNGTAKAGTDYTATSGTVTWNDGDASTKTVWVKVTRVAAGKQFRFNLTTVTGQTDVGSPNSAAVAVTASATAPPVTAPLTVAASPSAAALLSYLTGLATATNKQILTGQHTDYWTVNPMGNVNALYTQSGARPAILGTTYNIVGNPNIDGVKQSNDWLAAGGIVQFSWWAGNPALGVTALEDTNRNINFADLLNPSTQTAKNWYAKLDDLATKLKALNGPVMFRPFFECNGNWFWWGARDPAQFKQVWQQMHDYLVITKGVTNLLWVYNVNGGVGNYTTYYPGAAYVDVVSFDAYGPSANDAAMYNALAALNKPMTIAETGVNGAPAQPGLYSGDSNAMLQTIKTNFPKVVAVIVFCQNWSLDKQQGVEAFMSDPQSITLADLQVTGI